MPILSLCTGYGGLDMAVEALTGDKVAYVAENDEAASLVLAHHWPEVPNLGDITTYDFTQLAGEVDIITAGFSCQDISNAGGREGINGSKSKIWKDVCRAVRDIRPRYAFLENVAAIRSRGLDVVAEDLASVGYDLWWTTLRASDVGAAHIRYRWFGIAVPHAEGVRRPPWRAEPTQQQGEVRRSAGDGGQPSADPDRPRLEARDADAGHQGPPAGGSRPAAEDPYGPARDERGSAAPGQEARGGHGPTLDDEVSFLLPHAHGGGREGRAGDEPEPEGRDEPSDGSYSPAEWWGEYLPAIRRWEKLSGVPAPAPTEIGPRGGRRLAAPFAEWLMGVPGHVTGVPGLDRAQQLHKIGNGAMPQQAYVAYEHIFNLMKEAV
ncbi:DNA cytosine methyltransferase [Streptomyces sp. SBST2-5]|uniref:DNA (cytosine-5-)-methyltransferase n=1 Tax=Streptomyces composti TaxID=2720025 RepID=A0ABX1A4Y0_9ACTN|nr:DNA cytosine methyltransferase [Streptomyces composti]NJP50062.1 DNA cytosine methyltransferase [Streptomyces composti]